MATPLITKSHDNSGTGDEVFGLGSSERDLLISFNKLVQYLYYGSTGNATFAIDTNFDIKNTEAITAWVGGIDTAVADNSNFDTGTAATIAIDTWGIAILTWDGSAGVVTWASTAMSYPTEAAAIAALGTGNLIPATDEAPLGYVTVLTASGADWVAGTDALEGGTGGDPSDDTNYYNDPTLAGTYGARKIGNGSGTAISQ